MKITLEQWNLKVGDTVTMKNGKRLSVNEVDCGVEFWGTTQDGKQGAFRLENIVSIEKQHTKKMKNNFNITRGSGFHITFQNEWTVSVQWHDGSYSDSGFSTAEIAAWDKDNNWYDFGMDTVKGHVSANEVADFMSMIAAK